MIAMNIQKILKFSFAWVAAFVTTSTQAQDLMANQAPIDAKLRAVDSIRIQRLIVEESLDAPAEDLYRSWANVFVNYNVPLPAEYKIDLRQFHMPCESRTVNSHFGYRKQFRRNHYGTDIKVYVGDTIRAAFSGKVRVVLNQGAKKGYGKYIIIRHPNGLETVYGHLSKQLVAPDQIVKAGEPIALGGNTGFSTGPHLHFETNFLGRHIDPELLFSFQAHDVRGDFYVYRPNGRSELLAAHEVEGINNEQAVAMAASSKVEESRAFQQQKIASRSSKVYKVKQGDTLAKIARQHGTTIDRLCRLNNISSKSTLRVGQILKCS